MNFDKQLGFRPTPEMVTALNTLFQESQLNETATMKEFMEHVFNKALSTETTDNGLLLENEILKNTVSDLENERNEVSKTAIGLQLQLENLQNKEETPMFSPDTSYKLWCILQIFKKQNHDFTFENMINYVINAFQQKGFLKFDKADIDYLETIKHTYNGTVN